jgi:hypothetical protein
MGFMSGLKRLVYCFFKCSNHQPLKPIFMYHYPSRSFNDRWDIPFLAEEPPLT